MASRYADPGHPFVLYGNERFTVMDKVMKEAFLKEYEALCLKHGLMVDVVIGEEELHAVETKDADFTLDEALDEMRERMEKEGD